MQVDFVFKKLIRMLQLSKSIKVLLVSEMNRAENCKRKFCLDRKYFKIDFFRPKLFLKHFHLSSYYEPCRHFTKIFPIKFCPKPLVEWYEVNNSGYKNPLYFSLSLDRMAYTYEYFTRYF